MMTDDGISISAVGQLRSSIVDIGPTLAYNRGANPRLLQMVRARYRGHRGLHLGRGDHILD